MARIRITFHKLYTSLVATRLLRSLGSAIVLRLHCGTRTHATNYGVVANTDGSNDNNSNDNNNNSDDNNNDNNNENK